MLKNREDILSLLNIHNLNPQPPPNIWGMYTYPKLFPPLSAQTATMLFARFSFSSAFFQRVSCTIVRNFVINRRSLFLFSYLQSREMLGKARLNWNWKLFGKYWYKSRGPPYLRGLKQPIQFSGGNDMSKQRYLYIDGQRVPVSKKFYQEYQKFARKEKYFSVDLKVEEFICDPERRIAILLPGREDSYERLLEQDIQFPASEDESVEDAVIRVILLEKLRRALRTLPTDELRLIDEVFFQERTEREASAKLHLPKTTFRRKKERILEKLRNMLNENF